MKFILFSGKVKDLKIYLKELNEANILTKKQDGM
ncbi:hypothetical protein JOC73_000628 [Alkaliphilus hydrothermalis]|uniref:Uncharacterized protein n=1 Tax=Alkaliphilus hydrothermalis TaxID=1482730 RepID=A0ABS2NMH6_9FIRM|nr:hypothetical protein [Alkaliphilus hydrothermalis]